MDCLVTKLKGSISDESIAKLGEIKVHVSLLHPTTINFYSKKGGITYRISGYGYFTDADGVQNYGKTASQDDAYTNKYLSAGTYDVFIESKYIVDQIILNSVRSANADISFNIVDLYAVGTLDFIYVADCGVGDLTPYFNSGIMRQIKLRNTGFKADISSLKMVSDITSNEDVYFTDSKGISGNIDSLLAKLKFSIMTEVFKNAGSFTGDLSKINDSAYIISFKDCESANLTWTTERSSSAPILAIEGYPNFGSYLDAMLINQAKSTKSPSASLSYELAIEATGTRTSASDAAISNLQEKGFTVTVPAATDANSISLMSVNSLDSGNYGIAYKDKELIVEPVDLTKMQIYPAKGVSVQKFDTLENAEKFIKDNGLVTSENE